MNNKLIAGITTLILVGVAGILLYPKLFPPKQERKVAVNADVLSSQNMVNATTYYTCPMHPSVHKDAPGACPVCGMTLVKKTEGGELPSNEPEGIGSIAVSPTKQVLANVSTSIVRRTPMEKVIRAVGTVDYAEPNLRSISMRYAGRIEKLYVTYTGQKVHNGDPVADVYSPEGISAQQEYLLAKDSYDSVKGSNEIIASSALSLLEQSKQKLLLWGFTEDQIQRLEQSKRVGNIITIYSPVSGTVLKKNVDQQQYVTAGQDLYEIADLSKVWLNVDVYEYEMRGIKTGQRIDITSDVYTGETFTGAINFISPTIDPSSRTVRVRAEFANPAEKLKPEMFVTASLKESLPSGLVVPVSAVLSTGSRHIVWVQQHAGVFVPHVVKIGEHSDELIQIVDGLDDGDTVVTSGGYLLDSESQLQAVRTR